MAQQLEPDRAEFSDIPDWIVQSTELLRRRWSLFVALTLVHVGVSVLTRNMGFLTLTLGVVISQCCVMWVIQAARIADLHGTLSWAETFAVVQRSSVALVVVGLVCTALAIAAVQFGTLLGPRIPSVDYSQSKTFEALIWLTPSVVRFFFIYAVITMAGVWFFFPLLVFHSMTLVETVLLAKRADRKSLLVYLTLSYTPLFVFVLLLLISELALVAGTVFFPLFGVLQYVSYRHIFLRRRSNSPLPVSVQQEAGAGAA